MQKRDQHVGDFWRLPIAVDDRVQVIELQLEQDLGCAVDYLLRGPDDWRVELNPCWASKAAKVLPEPKHRSERVTPVQVGPIGVRLRSRFEHEKSTVNSTAHDHKELVRCFSVIEREVLPKDDGAGFHAKCLRNSSYSTARFANSSFGIALPMPRFRFAESRYLIGVPHLPWPRLRAASHGPFLACD